MIVTLLIIGWLIGAFATVCSIWVLRRLLRFDDVWDALDRDLAEYQRYLVDQTSRGIMTDHPEVREFHKRTTGVRDAMASHRASIASVRGKGEGWASISDETSTRA